MLPRSFHSPRAPFVAIFLIALGLFISAVYLGNALRLAACPLCILQRMASLALGCTALLGILSANHRWGRVLSALLMTASTATGAFIAAYQTYIQRIAPNVQCSGEAAWWELFVDWAGERSPLLFQASGLCSDPAWKLFGLSLAEYALMGFIALTLASLLTLKRR
ncbi:MAG: disulfide bond formation protein B [Sterolibacterium sp.]|jgi:disulfide bond formation protein DsbB|nr:disulfide bond formation protein B [Sterolibacterium sp.]